MQEFMFRQYFHTGATDELIFMQVHGDSKCGEKIRANTYTLPKCCVQRNFPVLICWPGNLGAGGTKPVLYASSVHTARAKNTCQVDEGRMQYRAWVHLSREGVFNCEGQSRD